MCWGWVREWSLQVHVGSLENDTGTYPVADVYELARGKNTVVVADSAAQDDGAPAPAAPELCACTAVDKTGLSHLEYTRIVGRCITGCPTKTASHVTALLATQGFATLPKYISAGEMATVCKLLNDDESHTGEHPTAITVSGLLYIIYYNVDRTCAADVMNVGPINQRP
jgi:hypothetical protein